MDGIFSKTSRRQ